MNVTRNSNPSLEVPFLSPYHAGQEDVVSDATQQKIMQNRFPYIYTLHPYTPFFILFIFSFSLFCSTFNCILYMYYFFPFSSSFIYTQSFPLSFISPLFSFHSSFSLQFSPHPFSAFSPLSLLYLSSLSPYVILICFLISLLTLTSLHLSLNSHLISPGMLIFLLHLPSPSFIPHCFPSHYGFLLPPFLFPFLSPFPSPSHHLHRLMHQLSPRIFYFYYMCFFYFSVIILVSFSQYRQFNALSSMLDLC